MALAWARQDAAPEGATVVSEREISPLGRLSEMWPAPAATTLAAAIVLRPTLPVELADAVWLVGGLASAEAAAATSGRRVGVIWPDTVVDVETEQVVGSLKTDIQLGPGQVSSAVLSIRLDLAALGLGSAGRDTLLDEVLGALDQRTGWLREGADGCALAAAAYDQSCLLLGRRVKVYLLPKGEARGVAQRVDASGRLEVVSATGMVERVSVNMLRRLEIVGEGTL
jgi:BirA family biotin operon repressor/biotin-[acetyl-CoA-carboxylase] ligase